MPRQRKPEADVPQFYPNPRQRGAHRPSWMATDPALEEGEIDAQLEEGEIVSTVQAAQPSTVEAAQPLPSDDKPGATSLRCSGAGRPVSKPSECDGGSWTTDAVHRPSRWTQPGRPPPWSSRTTDQRSWSRSRSRSRSNSRGCRSWSESRRRNSPDAWATGNRFQTVFIGNLYDGTEDELRSLFARIGPISSLRVVVDRETGKRKGFAFLEFFDQDTAQRAVHELNGVEFYGRALRVSIAEQDTKHGDSSSAPGPSRKRKGGLAGPPGSDRVAAVIAGTASAQLFELLQQAKALAAHQPHDLLALLEHQPHLLRALHLGLDRLVPPSAEQQQQQMQQQMQMQMQMQMQREQQRQQQQYQHQHQQHQPFLPPIMQTPASQPQPQPQQAPQAEQAGETEAMLRQVMSLTPQQLEALPVDQREQLIALKEELLRRQG